MVADYAIELDTGQIHVSLWTCGVMGLLHCPFDQFFTSSVLLQITYILVSQKVLGNQPLHYKISYIASVESIE